MKRKYEESEAKREVIADTLISGSKISEQGNVK